MIPNLSCVVRFTFVDSCFSLLILVITFISVICIIFFSIQDNEMTCVFLSLFMPSF